MGGLLVVGVVGVVVVVLVALLVLRRVRAKRDDGYDAYDADAAEPVEQHRPAGRADGDAFGTGAGADAPPSWSKNAHARPAGPTARTVQLPHYRYQGGPQGVASPGVEDDPRTYRLAVEAATTAMRDASTDPPTVELPPVTGEQRAPDRAADRTAAMPSPRRPRNADDPLTMVDGNLAAALQAELSGDQPSPEHVVKGVRGSRRYLVPGAPGYHQTRADRWFRTADEAERAGFRI